MIFDNLDLFQPCFEKNKFEIIGFADNGFQKTKNIFYNNIEYQIMTREECVTQNPEFIIITSKKFFRENSNSGCC